ncbi:MAG TPA: 30S ribosomal protein S2 [Candidatus Saccharimonadales bacterium]
MATVDVDVKKLLEAGAHFGHKTSRWHPKMAPFIHSKRDGSHIIDLTKTVPAMEKGFGFLSEVAGEGKQVLFVSTKHQAQDIVREAAEKVNMPFVTERWLGGMLTNWPTISGRIKHLNDLETKMASGEFEAKYNKLEIQRFQEEIDAMNELYGGIKHMAQRVGAVFIVDIVHDVNALKEARKLGLPVVALVDTNADPSLVTYPIPCNDDAIKTIQLVMDYATQAVAQGQAKVAKAAPDKDEKAAKPAVKAEAKEDAKAE